MSAGVSDLHIVEKHGNPYLDAGQGVPRVEPNRIHGLDKNIGIGFVEGTCPQANGDLQNIGISSFVIIGRDALNAMIRMVDTPRL